MFRRRKPNQPRSRPVDESQGISSIVAQRVNVQDDAVESINLDHEAFNEDGAELYGQARQIINRATNQQIGGNEYENFMIELANDVLANVHGRRLRFAEEEKPVSRGPANPHTSSLDDSFKGFTLDPGERTGHSSKDNEYDNGFFEETYKDELATGSGHSSGSGAYDPDLDADESIFTMNIDVDEDHPAEKTQLARAFSPVDFKWLCLSGAIPLNMICGLSNGISYCGPLGMLIGYLIVTPGVVAMLASLSEMIAFYPMDGGFTLLVSEYVESSLGLAIGVLYWLNCALTVPIELLQSVKLLVVFPYLDTLDNNNIVFFTYFLLSIVLFSCLATRAQSPAIRFASMLTMALILIMAIVIWFVCIPSEALRGTPLNFWRQSDGFRPTNSDEHLGVQRWRQVAHACSLCVRSYSGIDVPFTAMPEIRNARRTIKSGFHWILFRVLVIYLVLLLSFTFVTDLATWNVLFEVNPKVQVCNVKPSWLTELMRDGIFCSFLTTLSHANKCALFYLINAFLVFFGLFDAGFRLYGASRTLHGLGYSRVLWPQLAWCTRERVPLVAVGISSAVALVAYASVGVRIDAVFTYLQLFVTHSYLCVWAGVCLAFIRYFWALRLQQERTNISRNSEEYPFKSWLQPYSAMFAICWCIIMFIVTTTEQYYFNLSLNSDMWKGNMIAALGPLAILPTIYFGHKFWAKSKLVKLSDIGIMKARLKMDAEEWEEDRVYSDGIKDRIVRWFS